MPVVVCSQKPHHFWKGISEEPFLTLSWKPHDNHSWCNVCISEPINISPQSPWSSISGRLHGNFLNWNCIRTHPFTYGTLEFCDVLPLLNRTIKPHFRTRNLGTARKSVLPAQNYLHFQRRRIWQNICRNSLQTEKNEIRILQSKFTQVRRYRLTRRWDGIHEDNEIDQSLSHCTSRFFGALFGSSWLTAEV